MVQTVRLLRERGVESTLVYGESGSGPLDMLGEFERAFPMVDLERQLLRIQPDVVYAHRIAGCGTVKTLVDSGIPSLRFFHDHKLFCLREHKYTAIGQQTCARTIGPNCYACLGFMNRSSSWPGLRIQTVGRLQAEQRAHDGLSGYVVASRYMANHLVDHGFDPSKTHVLPLYTADPPRGESGPRDRNLLLFVGQIVRGKGLDVLLKSLAATPSSIRLLIVGTGAQEAEATRLARDLRIADRVQFAGKKSQAELSALYRTARCVVVPSRSPETFGQVGIEAMSYGTPVIATKIGGMTEWLTDGESGLFCQPNDVRSLAEAITRLTTDDGLAARLSEGARSSFQQRFTPDLHVNALNALLTRMSHK
jgi:glycosyltransferase involved in cell wall biosynthesis